MIETENDELTTPRAQEDSGTAFYQLYIVEQINHPDLPLGEMNKQLVPLYLGFLGRFKFENYDYSYEYKALGVSFYL